MKLDYSYEPCINPNGNWTYKDTKTGQLLNFDFKFCTHISDGHGLVILKDGSIWVEALYNGYRRVWLNNYTWTYFDSIDGELLSERFVDCDRASHDSAVVKLANGKWTIFNLGTRKVSGKCVFDQYYGTYLGYALVKVNGRVTLCNIVDEEIFDGETKYKDERGLVDLIRQYPSNFLKLNYYSFEELKLINNLLKAAYKGLVLRAKNADEKDSLAELEEDKTIVENIENFCKMRFEEYKLLEDIMEYPEKNSDKKISKLMDKIEDMKQIASKAERSSR